MPDPGARPEGASTGRRVAIGCFTAWLGAMSGAMVAALISKVVGGIMRAPACEGIPSCDWYIYALAGGALGAVSLPFFALRALGRSKRAGDAPTDRG